MFLGHTNPKICILVKAIVVNLCKITVLRKRRLKVKILHNLNEKNFENNFEILYDFQRNFS